MNINFQKNRLAEYGREGADHDEIQEQRNEKKSTTKWNMRRPEKTPRTEANFVGTKIGQSEAKTFIRKFSGISTLKFAITR